MKKIYYSAIPLFSGTTKVFAMNGTLCMKRIANSLTGKTSFLAYILVFLLSYSSFSQTQNTPATGPVSNNTSRFVSESGVSPDIKNMLNYYDQQVYFTENHGQWDSKVLYRADFKLGQAVATNEGMIVGTFDPAAVDAQSAWSERQEAAHISHTLFTEPEPHAKGNGWMMNFINHSPSMTVESQSKHKDVFNYFSNNQAESNVNSYQEIWYNNVYDNVDVRYYPSKDGSLEYDMICKPGFDKDAISIKMDGISKVILNKDGSLSLKTSVGDMSLPTPVAYQNIDGKRVPVEVHYEVSGNNIVTFRIDKFDETKTLLIDPIALRWATWLNTNSTGANHAHGIWIDPAGNIYTVARVDGSTNLITTGAFDTTANGGIDLIIGKYLEPDNVGGSGTRIWQTYVGGSDDDNPYACQLGPDGNLYITGYTGSTNFPLKGGSAFSGPSINTGTRNPENIFIMKISPDGQSIKASVIGGNGQDDGYDLRFTSTGDVVICGATASTNLGTTFPGTGATNFTKSNSNVLVFRINSNLDTIRWMKDYGGTSSSGADVATIMLDNPVNDDIFVAGYTSSTNFPTSSNARQATAVSSSTNGFIQKLKSNGTIEWSSYFNSLAKNDISEILCMEFNATCSQVYFGGITTGLATSNISAGAYQSKYGGNQDFFVANMDTNQTFVSGTYVGGSGDEINMMGLNTDQNNDVYILGYTSSTNFPVTSIALQKTNLAANSADNEVFLKLYTTLDSLEYSTYYGGSEDDYDPIGERGIKFSNCRIYTLVTSESNNIPLTYGALNTTKLSASSGKSPIYEPGLVVWSNPPDLLNNTITGSQTVCKGSEPDEFMGSVPVYSLPIISRDNDTSAYPSVGSSTVYQWQSSTDSINWTNVPGGTTQNLDSAQIGHLSVTTYFRRIISGDACIIAGAAEQTVKVVISVVNGTIKNLTCFDSNNGSITANPTGPSPYKFTWSNGDTSRTISNLAAGTYTVTVVDKSNCTYANSFIVTQPTLLQVSIKSHINPTSCDGHNGSAIANAATGGTSPYTYNWTPSGGTGLTASNLTAGTYTITATDSNNCTATATVVINVPPSSLTASITSETNVACYGADNGSAIVSVSGGTEPYTYSWNTQPVQTSDTAKNLTAGTYTVTVTDSESCTTTATAIIGQSKSPLSASISAQTNVSCYGGNNGSATVTPSGGTVPYTYSWNVSGKTSDTANNLAAGTYTVTVTDANKCSATTTAIITQPNAALSASISSQTSVLCYGGNTGSAIAGVSGGTQPYTYSWNTQPVQTSDTAKNLSAGTYTVTVTDANGCSAAATVIIAQPQSALSASISSHINVSCFGGDGSASVAVSGGTKPYTYSWSSNPVQSTDTATNLPAGTYVVTVTDSNNCSTTASVIITSPSGALSALITSQTNVSCYGGNNGSATVTASAGIAPYTYSWSNGPTTAKDSGLTAGTYSVTVTDSGGCIATATAIITQPQAALSASISSQTNVSCYGGNNGSATVTANGGTAPYTYSWSNSVTTAKDSGLVAGTYSVTVTDSNGCSTTATAIITQPQAALSASISSQTNVSCYGGNNGSATVTANGGTTPYTYSWSNSVTTAKDSGLVAGTYSVTVTDSNGCSTIATAIITQPQAALSASISSQTNVSCYGGNNSSATVTANGGTTPYTYSWSNSVTTAKDSGLVAGTYSVTVTDSNGCTTSATAIITQPQAALSASISSQTNVSCYGGNNGSATVTANGGTAPYTYSWSNSVTTDKDSGLVAGTYSVTVTDSNGCSTIATAIITQPLAALSASISAQTNVSCYGGNSGSATVTASGGTTPYTYSWSNSVTTAKDSGLVAGTYSVTVTDSNGCSTIATAIITQPLAALSASISAQTNVSCYGGNNGSATVTANGGTTPYTYSWSNSVTTAKDSGLVAGTYSVTVTDSNGCTSTATAIITQPLAALSASISTQTNVSCYGGNGSASVAVSGGTQPYTYSWNSNPVQTADTATNLPAGTYVVTVTDSNGCTTSATAIITQPAGALNASISSQTNVLCYGGNNGSATVTASAGMPPYTYAWSNGETSATDTDLVAGTYSVTVTDSGGCISSATAIITQPQAALSASISSQTNVSCYGGDNGSATVNVTGGTTSYLYTWTPSGGNAATASGLTAGTYTVTVTDANNCIAQAQAIITQPLAALSASIGISSATICSGSSDTLTASASGGTGKYSYNWSPVEGNTASITVSPSITTTYMVTVTDSNNCTTSASITVNVNQSPQLSITAIPSTPICTGNNDTLSVSGADSYTWSPATGLSSTIGSLVIANPTMATTYTITGTNDNGCANTTTVTVGVNALPTVSLSGLNPYYCANAPSPVTLTGIPPANSPYGLYTGNGVHLPSPDPSKIAYFILDSAGVGGPYTITYTYTDSATGCKNSASLPVTILPTPNVTVTPDSPTVCSGVGVTLEVISPTPGASYTWSPSTGLSSTTGTSVISNTGSTTVYTITATSDSGCVNTDNTKVTVAVLPIVTITPPPPGPNICLGNSIVLNASGGSTYTWTPATGLSCSSCSSTVASPTVTTEYIVDVSNGSCSATDTVIVGVYSVTVKAGPDQHILDGQIATLSASGATYYTWNPANTLNNDSISDPMASPTVTTTYTVTGRDSIGCISIDTLVVYVSSPCDAMAPSAFTPLASNNRYFHILSQGGIELLDFKVFNRWGQEMYETTSLSAPGWDGTWLGKEQPQDTYVYWAEILCEGKINFMKGNVTLIR